jgi:hypothetical protein
LAGDDEPRWCWGLGEATNAPAIRGGSDAQGAGFNFRCRDRDQLSVMSPSEAD